MSPRAVAGFVFVGVLVGSARVHASEPVVFATDASLSGSHTYHDITVKSGSTLHVLPYNPSSPTDTGRLILYANTITVEAGGAINADGAGYPGAEGADGHASVVAASGRLGSDAGLPGGGGGFSLDGGAGGLETDAGGCVLLPTASGGAAINPTDVTPIALGSAGGAGNVAPATCGGSGGGVIVLVAASVTIDGTLSANGAPASFPVGGVAAGGDGGA